MSKHVVILLGAPGSGKGSQATLIKDRLNIAHISTGDMLRDEVKKETQLGLEISSVIKGGNLIDDQLMTSLISSRIAHNDCKNGFILDGYPRTLEQVKLLDSLLKDANILKYSVVSININDDILVKRVVGRFSCTQCGKIYNDYFSRPKIDNVCDVCFGTVFDRRKDDNEETLKNRLTIYHKNSNPIIDYYTSKGNLITLDGTLDAEVLATKIVNKLKNT